jgi:LysM repeat protein
MTEALNQATAYFNQNLDPSNPIAQRGSYSPTPGGASWLFQTSPYLPPDRLSFQGDDLIIQTPNQTQEFYATFDPNNATVLGNEVTTDLAQVYQPPPGVLPPDADQTATQNAINDAVGNGTLAPASTYTLQDGDSLDTIAQQFNTSVPRILEANGMDPNNPPELEAGQVLNIPDAGAPASYAAEYPIDMGSSGIPGATYTARVLQNQDGTAGAVLVAHFPQTGASLYYQAVPETLPQPLPVVPPPVTPPPVATNVTQALAQSTISSAYSSGNLLPASTYTMQDGDSLDTLASQFNTTVPQLLEANGMDPNNPPQLQTGQVLSIPGMGAPSNAVAGYPIDMGGAAVPGATYTALVLQNNDGSNSLVLEAQFPKTGATVYYQALPVTAPPPTPGPTPPTPGPTPPTPGPTPTPTPTPGPTPPPTPTPGPTPPPTPGPTLDPTPTVVSDPNSSQS